MEDQGKKIPTHVSIIMDGNGRWAKERGRERIYGHQNGLQSIREVAEECGNQGIKYLSIYAFSEENWSRPKDEVDCLMKLMMKSIADEYENFMKNGVKLIVLGHRSMLGSFMDESIAGLEKATKDNKNLTLIVFLSYSGQWDITQAARRYAEDVLKDPSLLDRTTPEVFSHYLVTDGIPDPDLIIRTSGEQRISNYLLWQGAYSEFYFTPVYWPDFRAEEFRKALLEYSSRDRRDGKVK